MTDITMQSHGHLRNLAQDPNTTVLGPGKGTTTRWVDAHPDDIEMELRAVWAAVDAAAAAKPTWTMRRVVRFVQDNNPAAARTMHCMGKEMLLITCGHRAEVPADATEHAQLGAEGVQEARRVNLGHLQRRREHLAGRGSAEKVQEENMAAMMVANLRPIEPGELEGVNVVSLDAAIAKAGYDPSHLDAVARKSVVARQRAAGMTTDTAVQMLKRHATVSKALPAATDEDVEEAAAVGALAGEGADDLLEAVGEVREVVEALGRRAATVSQVMALGDIDASVVADALTEA